MKPVHEKIGFLLYQTIVWAWPGISPNKRLNEWSVLNIGGVVKKNSVVYNVCVYVYCFRNVIILYF